jgi:pimeloyl-ACP methyl ester carboxylesterase
VTIQIQDQTTNASNQIAVQILRPPVVLIHGKSDSSAGWNNFSPLVTGPGTGNPLFSVGRVDYGGIIGRQIQSVVPAQPNLAGVRASELGFDYNAPSVMAQISQWIGQFKSGNNPANIPVAAIQADIVAHSMGGLITRDLVLQPSFLSATTFGEGTIHKLISIDTPHLGSQVAMNILGNGQYQETGCLVNLLAKNGVYSIASATLRDGTVVSGAAGDLQGDDATGSVSPAIASLNSSSQHPIRFSPISGVYTNWGALDSSLTAAAIRHWPFGCPSDPLAQQLTGVGWSQIFHNNPTDGVVSAASQLDGFPDTGGQFSNELHSAGLEKLGFSGPTVLDAGPVPAQVILLLNAPINGSSFSTINP